ncbi:MAG: cohesin domain-containing protein [Bryobacteraceae bacterium]
MWPVPRFALPFCLAFLGGTPLAFCSDVSIPASVAGPGASVPVPVSFASGGSSVSGLQFDLVFDNSALSLTTVVGLAARSSGKTVYIAPLSSRQTRFLITELNQNTISDGAIVQLFVNVGPGVAPGAYSIHFESVVATDPSGQSVPMSSSDGTVNVEPIYVAPVSPVGVLNGASLLPGPVAPGEIVTIIGSAMAAAATPQGASVRFDSFPAPLLYQSSDQINAVVPFGIAGRTSTTLEIANSSGLSTSISVPVADSAPALFTLGASGTGQGAILNQDTTVNSPDNPAQRGTIIVVYATGAGQTNPPGTDGLIPAAVLPKPVLPVSIQIGGVLAGILYAGAAPGMISGVLQVNCRVPLEIDAGKAVPVVLTVGTAASPPVTVALK